jgi:hypothetical protein
MADAATYRRSTATARVTSNAGIREMAKSSRFMTRDRGDMDETCRRRIKRLEGIQET